MSGKRSTRGKNPESKGDDQVSHDEFEQGAESSKKQSNANESSKRRRTEKRFFTDAQIQHARAKSFAANHLPIFSVGHLDGALVGLRFPDFPLADQCLPDAKPASPDDASISATPNDRKEPCSTAAGRLRAWTCLKTSVGLYGWGAFVMASNVRMDNWDNFILSPDTAAWKTAPKQAIDVHFSDELVEFCELETFQIHPEKIEKKPMVLM